MSQATIIIVCRRSQAARGRTGEFQGYVREDKNARSSNGPWKEKLQISWGKPATNLACMRTQQEVPKVTGRLDRDITAWWGDFCLSLSSVPRGHLPCAPCTWGCSSVFLSCCSCSCAPVARPSLADIGGGRRGCAVREAAGQKWSTQSWKASKPASYGQPSQPHLRPSPSFKVSTASIL